MSDFGAMLTSISRHAAESVLRELLDHDPRTDTYWVKDEYQQREIPCPRCKGEGALRVGIIGPGVVGTMRRCDFHEGDMVCREGRIYVPQMRTVISPVVVIGWIDKAERGE